MALLEASRTVNLTVLLAAEAPNIKVEGEATQVVDNRRQRLLHPGISQLVGAAGPLCRTFH